MDKNALQQKLLETFRIEANEDIASIQATLLLLAGDLPLSQCQTSIENIYREIHNLKGAARAVSLSSIEQICHALEKIFAALKKEWQPLSTHQLDLLHHIFTLLHNAVAVPDNVAIRLDEQQSTTVLAQLENFFKAATAENTITPVQDIAPVLADTSTLMSSFRVSAKRLDTFLLNIEEMLVIKQLLAKFNNQLQQAAQSIHGVKKAWQQQAVSALSLTSALEQVKTLEASLTNLSVQLESDSDEVNRLVDNLLVDAKSLVMLPFGILLDSFPIMVRNIASAEGKHIHFKMEGTDIELDKRILDALKDPLIHLIRNCIDHGIEPREQRQHKSPTGLIEIIISQYKGNEVEIVIRDDGQGIDANALKEAAVRTGVLSVEDAKQLSQHDALALMYRSGVTTSAAPSTVSGNGLGMAIVREKVEALGGHLAVQTELGKGTCLTITIPVALTFFKGILIQVGQQKFILPTSHLDAIIRVSPQEIKTVETRPVIHYNDATLALVQLSDLLQLNATQPVHLAYQLAVVVQVGGQRAAFLVDDIFEEHEILVKKLSKPLVRVQYVAAATLLESGLPVPILNINALMKSVVAGTVPAHQQWTANTVKARKSILLVEDSITTRTLLKHILEMAGYAVTTAVDGLDGWRQLTTLSPALIISDIEMPHMSGLELTEKIRQHHTLTDLPIILVTSLDTDAERGRGIDAGANAYIVKSRFDDSDFLAVIKRFI